MKFSPQNPYELPGTAREAEAARTYSSNTHMGKSAGTYDSMPPNLMDSDSESDYESELEADQEHVVKEVNIKHQLDLFPNIT